jgi:acyl-CoA thioester hydrolase
MQIPQPPAKEPQSLLVARFQDCDPFGHLNNARYIDYFLNARQDHLLEHYSFRTYEPDMQASWVVRTTQIAYLRPVNAMEEILVRTRLIHFAETALVVEGLMLDKEARTLKALIWFDFVYISLTNGRPAKHPQELMQLFESVVFPAAYDPDGFKSRVEEVRLEIRKGTGNEE